MVVALLLRHVGLVVGCSASVTLGVTRGVWERDTVRSPTISDEIAISPDQSAVDSAGDLPLEEVDPTSDQEVGGGLGSRYLRSSLYLDPASMSLDKWYSLAKMLYLFSSSPFQKSWYAREALPSMSIT